MKILTTAPQSEDFATFRFGSTNTKMNMRTELFDRDMKKSNLGASNNWGACLAGRQAYSF
jgi:hypothetical protein